MGTTDGFSTRGSRRHKGMLPFVVAPCIAAAALALILPSSTGAMHSPSGPQKRSSHDKRHDSEGGKRQGDSAVQDARSAPTPAPVVLPGRGERQAVSGFQIRPSKVRHGVATFRLRGIAARSIRAAYLKQGKRKRRLSLKRVRRAAQRGVLRLRLGRKHRSRKLRASVSRPRKKTKPVLILVTDPGPDTGPRACPATTPTPAPGPIRSWRAVGSRPLSDATARSLVTPRTEIRPANDAANHYVPTASELAAFHGAASNPLAQYVTGGFAGTTDEILQWGAHKWGIPEDILRAVAVQESWWRQAAMGDRRDGVDAVGYPHSHGSTATRSSSRWASHRSSGGRAGRCTPAPSPFAGSRPRSTSTTGARASATTTTAAAHGARRDMAPARPGNQLAPTSRPTRGETAARSTTSAESRTTYLREPGSRPVSPKRLRRSRPPSYFGAGTKRVHRGESVVVAGKPFSRVVACLAFPFEMTLVMKGSPVRIRPSASLCRAALQ